MKHWIAIWVIAICIFFGASALNAQTQGELDDQSCGQFHRADVALNKTYSKILQQYANDPQFIAKLKTAQRAWLAFRDAQLEALYPKDNKQAEYGTVYPMCRCSKLQSLTEERTKQLKVWIFGAPEGMFASVVSRSQGEPPQRLTIK